MSKVIGITVGTPLNPEKIPGGGGSSVELDATLSVEGKAADAKAVGDAIASVMGAYVADLAELIGGGA